MCLLVRHRPAGCLGSTEHPFLCSQEKVGLLCVVEKPITISSTRAEATEVNTPVLQATLGYVYALPCPFYMGRKRGTKKQRGSLCGFGGVSART